MKRLFIFWLVLFLSINANAQLSTREKGRLLVDNVQNTSYEEIALNKVKYFLSLGADINYSERGCGLTALHYALEKKYKSVVEYLIKEGADLNIRFDNGKSNLHMIEDDFIDILIDNGMNPEIKDFEGKTPMHYAVNYHKYNVIRLLLKRNAEIDSRDSSDSTPLMNLIAQSRYKWDPMIDSLLVYGADINAQRKDGATPLTVAVFCSQKCVNDLKRRGAIAIQGAADYPDIFKAVMADDTIAVKSWLDIVQVDYFDFDKPPNFRCTPIEIAIKFSSRNSFFLLLEYGADPEYEFEGGLTLVHKVAKYQRDPIYIHELIKRGVNVNTVGKNENGRSLTPLHYAACYGNDRVIEVLLQAGAKRKKVDWFIQGTPLVLAATYGHSKAVEALSKDKKALKKYGGYAILTAVAEDHLSVVEKLLELGANPNKSGKHSALQLATKNKNWEMVKLLKEYGAK